MRYVEIPATVIGDRELRLAEWTADTVATLIGTPPVAVRWFSEGAVADWPWATLDEPNLPRLAGLVQPWRPRTVWLHQDLRGLRLIRTVAHEVVHSKQIVRGLGVTRAVSDDTRAIAEHGAERFAEAFTRRVEEGS